MPRARDRSVRKKAAAVARRLRGGSSRVTRSARPMTGAERLCRTLEALGADTVFGLPGQPEHRALRGASHVAAPDDRRRSRARSVLHGERLRARIGPPRDRRHDSRARASPTRSPGLAEALLDSAPVLHILGRPAHGSGSALSASGSGSAGRRRLPSSSASSRSASAGGNRGHDLARPTRSAQSGEPGPVIVQIPSAALSAEASESPSPQPREEPPETPPIDDILDRLKQARRPMLYVGQGAFGAAPELRELVEALRIARRHDHIGTRRPSRGPPVASCHSIAEAPTS